MSGNFNTDGDSQSLFFDNFMNVFENLNDLWHDNNLFDNLFENVRDLNKSFLV